MKEQRPLIIDIKRHALHDGPGIRTTVFFKGCPLRCVWCHNPEGIEPGLEIGFYPSDCILCGECAKVCPTGAARMSLPGLIDRTLCNNCGKCADACPGRGLRRIGRYYEIDELLDILLRDKVFYEVSGGGVTLSGGEPALHADYASRLLQKLKALGVHTAIETSGYFEWDRFNDLMLDWLDLILFDVKLADPELHAKYTGQRNDTILKTLALLAGKRPDDIIARVPLIPGITTSRDNLFRLSGILHDLGINRCCLLPYNPSGFSKRNNIGQPPVNLPEHLLTGEEIHRCEVLFPRLELVEV